jgi:hypothetical protein
MVVRPVPIDYSLHDGACVRRNVARLHKQVVEARADRPRAPPRHCIFGPRVWKGALEGAKRRLVGSPRGIEIPPDHDGRIQGRKSSDESFRLASPRCRGTAVQKRRRSIEMNAGDIHAP